jgi:hypothetical protein
VRQSEFSQGDCGIKSVGGIGDPATAITDRGYSIKRRPGSWGNWARKKISDATIYFKMGAITLQESFSFLKSE